MTTEMTKEMIEVMKTGARLSEAMFSEFKFSRLTLYGLLYSSVKDERLFTRAESVRVID